MSQRKITFFNTQTSSKEVVLADSGEIWGEIKKKVSMGIRDKTLVIGGSKLNIDYEIDQALLPELAAFTVFVYPKESKGGLASKKKPSKKAKPAKKASKGGKKKKAVPAKKKVVKKAKKAVKKTKVSSKKAIPAKVKSGVAVVVSSLSAAEVKRIHDEIEMEREAREIGRAMKRKGY